MTDIEQVLLNRVKLIGDGEWSLIGTPQELIDEINRLLVEAELKGFNIAFDCHDYDRLRAYKQELSNNLNKGDV